VPLCGLRERVGDKAGVGQPFFPQPLEASGENPLGVKPTLISIYMGMVEIK